MTNQLIKRIDPNKCNKKLVELCQTKINSGWIDKTQRKWKKDIISNKQLLEGTEPSYLYRENKYARIVAGYLPTDIPECWRVQCVIEGYEELKSDKKIKDDDIKPISEKKKAKFEFRRKAK